MNSLQKITIFLVFSLLLLASPGDVWAQSGSPGDNTPTTEPAATTSGPGTTLTPNVPTGVITGKVINQNDTSKSLGDLEVMLHVLDKDQNELGMLHGKSTQDGSYEVADVPFQEGMSYVAAVAYEGTTYYSQLSPSEAGKIKQNIDVPVYESTADLSKVEIGQMHVLFDFSSDGMDVKEVYALSNLGDRTVKDGVEIPGKNGAKATVQFSLPEKADFVNFQPNDETRFIKYPGGFVDTAGIAPGEMSNQVVVGYLLPYANPLTFQLKTFLPVKSVNFVLPKDSGVALKGDGLGDPEPVTSQDGQTFFLYKMKNIPAGKTVDLTFEGKPIIPQNQTASVTNTTTFPNQPLPLVGLGLLGLVLVGGGAFWWVRSSRKGETDEEAIDEEDLLEDDQSFERLLTDIAQLDQRFERGELDEAAYHQQRSLLKHQAAQALPAKGAQSNSVPVEIEENEAPE